MAMTKEQLKNSINLAAIIQARIDRKYGEWDEWYHATGYDGSILCYYWLKYVCNDEHLNFVINMVDHHGAEQSDVFESFVHEFSNEFENVFGINLLVDENECLRDRIYNGPLQYQLNLVKKEIKKNQSFLDVALAYYDKFVFHLSAVFEFSNLLNALKR